jgi:geranylgeranyl reductase family protein
MDCVRCDVVVVGGGPAGCIAAAELASGGLDVMLLEKAAVPRHKCCAGGLTRNALALLPQGVCSLVHREVRTMIAASLGGDSLAWKSDEPFIFTAPRAEVDAYLWRHAVASGAGAHDNTEVAAVTRDEGGVTVTTSTGTIEAGYLIAADGANGRLARMMGNAPAAHVALGIALDVEGNRTRPAVDDGAAKVVLGFGDGVWGWVFPHANGSNIGIEAHWGVKDIEGKLGTLLEFEGYTWDNVVRRCAHPIPSLPGAGALGAGRVLFAGDAAALVHPLTGEGVRYAALSGRLAARAILDGHADPVESYRRSVEQEIIPDLQSGMSLLRLASGRERFAIPAARHNRRIYDSFMNVLAGRSTFSDAIEELGGLGRLGMHLAGGAG